MKRIINLSLVIILGMVTISAASAQEKKSENRIKVVIDDGSGSKTMIDTVFTDDMPEKLKLEDGNYVYIKKGDGDIIELPEVKGSKKIIVTVNSESDNDQESSQEKSIVVHSGDGAVWHSAGSSNVVVIKDGKVIKTDDGKRISISMSAGSEKETEATRIVIAKDGMVISVESEDEKKAEDLMKVIREHLESEGGKAK